MTGVCAVPGKNNNVKDDPLWEIPIRDLIRYLRKVEEAYSKDSPREILTRIRLHYYNGLRFQQLFPEAPIVEVPSVAIGVPTMADRRMDRANVGAEAYDHLTSHPRDDQGKPNNPSPYAFLDNCEKLDIGHLLLGLEALRSHDCGVPYSTFGIPRIDPASWVADLAADAPSCYRHEQTNGKETGPMPEHRAIGSRKPDESPEQYVARVRDVYFNVSAPSEDLLADVDAFGLDKHWDGKKPLSKAFEEYYLGGGVAKRWDHFRTHDDNKWAFELGKSAIRARVYRLADLVFAGKLTAAVLAAHEGVTGKKPDRFSHPSADTFIDRFFRWVDKKDGLAPP